jgi:hypothetical protein
VFLFKFELSFLKLRGLIWAEVVETPPFETTRIIPLSSYAPELVSYATLESSFEIKLDACLSVL